jgi:hypothetical protein
MFELTATCTGKRHSDIENALGEIKRLVSEGCLSGTDSKDTGGYWFQVRETDKSGRRGFCAPMDTAERSTPQAVSTKLATLINVLDDLTPSVISGDLCDVAARLHGELIRWLRAEGWKVTTHKTKSAWVVKPPARRSS